MYYNVAQILYHRYHVVKKSWTKTI